MKKKDIVHPKLYFKYDVVDQQTQLFYYSNQLDSAGSRLVKVVLLNQNSFSGIEMYKLNEKEYHNLNLYIERQERIMDTYLKKGFKVSGNDNLVGGEIQNVDPNINFYQYEKSRSKNRYYTF